MDLQVEDGPVKGYTEKHAYQIKANVAEEASWKKALKVLVVLTPTEVVDKQEPVTTLRPDEYSTPVKEDKKWKVKQEGTSPSSRRKKRVKQEAQIKEEGDTTEMGQIKQEIQVKIKKEEPDPTSYYQSPMRDEPEDVIKEIVGHGGVVDLSEWTIHFPTLCLTICRLRREARASPTKKMKLTKKIVRKTHVLFRNKLGIDSSNRWGNSNTTVRH
ncbi:hypothetical protein EDB81DRAFT_953714 [Dactylonectria macrodidyma]|uniref:Uncharacterized protein n=1 Tax=Dactylonectria macrodidyma TaxID=307937 RepID=A0A9P9D3Y8_9HYPO|nr:hypothetical protein EDB81DRAFT_953714 [Dactylonectria macrodidyma]